MHERMRITAALPYILICALSFRFVSPLLQKGFYQSHDGFTHIFHLIEINTCLRHGIIYPRWFFDMYWGYGGSVLTFYPPFIYYSVLPFYWLTQSYFAGFKIAITTGVIVSGFLMYSFARIYWEKAGSLLAAVAYIYAPYHIIDIYVRGAYLESLNYIFLPALLIIVHKVVTTGKRHFVALFSLVLGISFISHIMSFLFIFILLPYALLHTGRSRWRQAMLLAVGFVLAICMTTFYWLPLGLQKSFTHTMEIARNHFDFHDNFANLPRLISPAWPWGDTVPGPGNMSLQIGMAHIIFFFLSLLAIPWLTVKQRRVTILFQGLGLLCIFMTLPQATFLWEKLPFLFLLQFPWRLLLFVNFFLSFAAGAALRTFSGRGNTTMNWMAVFGIIFMLVIYGSYCRAIYPDLIFPSESDCNRATIYKKALGWHEPQYVPKWVKQTPMGPPEAKVVLEREGKINEVRIAPYKLSFNYLVPTETRCMVNIFYYPGWECRIDGRRHPIQPKELTGEIVIILPAGKHRADLQFTNPPSVMIAQIISLVSLFITIRFVIPLKRKNGAQ